jgi:stage II sporulation protein D
MIRVKRASFLPVASLLLAGLAPLPVPAGVFSIPTVESPVMRIGLTAAEGRVVTLSARGGLRLVDAETGEAPWQDIYQGEVRVVLLGSGGGRTVYRVQVGSFADEKSARELAERLERETGQPARVHHDPQRRLYRVRVGEFGERLQARELNRTLGGLGFPDAWIASEAQGDDSRSRLRVVNNDYEEKVVGRRRLVAMPAEKGLVAVGGRRYRGIVELAVDSAGRLRVVNRVNLEEYLRGVVPDEMGPGVFPEIEALKAQAVAARTYAVRNRGQFADEGFDICDTPRCQVYGGADSEHPRTDEAIADTRGEVLTHDGKLINSMFTSTCGGHTEDVENVFPEQAEAYLRGVVCAPESGKRKEVVGYLDGHNVTGELASSPALARWGARLVALGVLESVTIRRQEVPAALTSGDWRNWLRRVAPVLGKPPPEGEAERGKAVTRGRLALDLVALLQWGERLERLLSGPDAMVLLGLDPGRALPQKARRAGAPELALLVREGILEPMAHEAGDPVWTRPVAMDEAVAVLGRLVERYAGPMVREVRVENVAGGRLATEEDGELPVVSEPFLFAATGAGPVPVFRLALTRHEPVLIHQDGNGRVDYLEATRPFRSLGDDRFSRRYSWEVTVEREDLSKRLSRFLSFGKLQDLAVARRGVSGRVAELEVIGSRGRSRLVGFDVRVALQLNENLFTIERIRRPDGTVRAFVFAGKGWGHGIGLCQVGSYGMAVRGRSYREILAHYYTDTRLVALEKRPELLEASVAAPVE